MAATNSKIIYNVSINNIDVSGLTKFETEEKFEKIVSNILDDQIILKYGEYEKTISLKQIELSVNIQDTVFKACTVGRDKDIISNNYKIINTLIYGENIDFEYSFNDDIVESIFNGLDEEWDNKFIDNSYYIDGNKLIIVRGTQGIVIDKNALKEMINNIISKKISGEKINEIQIPITVKNPSEIDVEKIRNEIYREAKNASYNDETSTLYTHIDGVDFDVTIDEAYSILKEDKEEYEIPLNITKPDITTDKLGEEAFPEKISSFSTRYDASNTDRSTNLELAAEAINGTILLPGEIFSFNKVVGPRTPAKGYKLAGAYSSEGVVQSYGGGVCQVSTTIYNAALFANLDIVERYNHGFVVSYVDNGRDATVSYGAVDFKFKNSRTYAIKMVAFAKNGIMTVELWGIPEKEEFEIELESEDTDVIIRNTKYVYDSSLGKNEEVVKTIGADGAKSITYKIVKKNGNILSKNIISKDNYSPMTKVILTGDISKAK